MSSMAGCVTNPMPHTSPAITVPSCGNEWNLNVDKVEGVKEFEVQTGRLELGHSCNGSTQAGISV